LDTPVSYCCNCGERKNNKRRCEKWRTCYLFVGIGLIGPIIGTIYAMHDYWIVGAQKISWFIMVLVLLLQIFISYVLCLFLRFVKFSSISETLAKSSTETTILATYLIVGSSFMVSGLGVASCYTIPDEDYPMFWKSLLILAPPICSLIIVMPLSNDFYRIRVLNGDMFEKEVKWTGVPGGQYWIGPTNEKDGVELALDFTTLMQVQHQATSGSNMELQATEGSNLLPQQVIFSILRFNILPCVKKGGYKAMHYAAVSIGVLMGVGAMVFSIQRSIRNGGDNLPIIGQILSCALCLICLPLFLLNGCKCCNRECFRLYRKLSLILEYMGLYYFLWGMILACKSMDTII